MRRCRGTPRSSRPIWEPGMPSGASSGAARPALRSPPPGALGLVPDPGIKELLRVDDLHAWYGESHILHGMSFTVGEGELVTLLGRNGAGKTTTLRAIMGIMAQRRG